MPPIVSVDNYLDLDVAYLLGMVCARGTFHVEGDIRRLTIDFPFKITELEMSNLPGKVNREAAIRLALDEIRNCINQLLEVNVDLEPTKHKVQLRAVFTKNTMSWRNLTHLLGDKLDYRQFSLPEIIYTAPPEIQTEFIRGIADTASNPSPKDYYIDGRHRIVLEFQHPNWIIPIQVCRLLQQNLQIKVHNILWGHPNLRGSAGWAKEHRMRIFAEDFQGIGYSFSFKQQLFENLLKQNKKIKDRETDFCNPKVKQPRKAKPRYKDEKSKDLPSVLRKHFNSYFQICLALGCTQGEPSPQGDLFEEDDA